MFGTKEVGIDAAINIDCANTVISHNQWSAHDRTNTICHDTLLLLQGFVSLRVVSEYRLPGLYHAIHGAAAIFIGTSINRLSLFIESDSKVQLIIRGVQQREETAFRIDETDHLFHYQSQ